MYQQSAVTTTGGLIAPTNVAATLKDRRDATQSLAVPAEWGGPETSAIRTWTNVPTRRLPVQPSVPAQTTQALTCVSAALAFS